MIEKTMIERLAEKLWETNAPELAPDYDALDADDQVKVQLIVEVLLEEMLEPTDEMLVEGEHAAGLDSFEKKKESPSYKCWQAMIKKALEG